MNKVFLYGRNSADIEPLVLGAGFTIVKENPDFIISYGGDGTMMKAEAEYPGILKVLLRDSQICKKCSTLSNSDVLTRVREGKYAVEKLMKLQVQAGNKILHGLNDIIIHNQDARHAIRYSVKVNGKNIGAEIIGDGLVIATPFGSTGYYRSITDSYFEIGIGLAFNNSTEQSDHIVLKEDSVIKINIVRGPMVIYADNQGDEIHVAQSEEVTVLKSPHTAHVVIPVVE
jgi:NAD+ kinase